MATDDRGRESGSGMYAAPARNKKKTCLPCALDKKRCDGQRPCIGCLMNSRAKMCVDKDRFQTDEVALRRFIDKLRPAYQKRKYKRSHEASDEKRDSRGARWVEATSPLIKPLLKSICDEKGPIFMLDLMTRSRAWRTYLSYLNLLLEDGYFLTARDDLVSEAMTACVSEKEREDLMNFGQMVPYTYTRLVGSIDSQVPMSEVELDLVKEVFDVDDVYNSDLALLHSRKQIMLPDNMVENYILNSKMARVIGLDSSDVEKDTCLSTNKPTVPLWFTAFTEDSGQWLLTVAVTSLLRGGDVAADSQVLSMRNVKDNTFAKGLCMVIKTEDASHSISCLIVFRETVCEVDSPESQRDSASHQDIMFYWDGPES